MNTTRIVQSLMEAIQRGEFDQARSLLSDDFHFGGAGPGPINRETWLRLGMSLRKAFANLQYNFHAVSGGGDVVRVVAEIKGTHNADLDLRSMNLGMFPATYRTFATARQYGAVAVIDDKVASWAMEPTEGAGLMAILDQLGVTIPSM
jgi:hypothetical protein